MSNSMPLVCLGSMLQWRQLGSLTLIVGANGLEHVVHQELE